MCSMHQVLPLSCFKSNFDERSCPSRLSGGHKTHTQSHTEFVGVKLAEPPVGSHQPLPPRFFFFFRCAAAYVTRLSPQLLPTAVTRRQELPVLSRWFEEGTVETPEAKYLDIILYRWEPIITCYDLRGYSSRWAGKVRACVREVSSLQRGEVFEQGSKLQNPVSPTPKQTKLLHALRSLSWTPRNRLRAPSFPLVASIGTFHHAKK